MRVFHDSVLVSKYMQRPTGAAVFIVDSCVLIPHFFIAKMIVISINRKNAGYIPIF